MQIIKEAGKILMCQNLESPLNFTCTLYNLGICLISLDSDISMNLKQQSFALIFCSINQNC